MRKGIAMLLCWALLLSGCGSSTPEIYEITWLDLFDTVAVLKGTAADQASFEEIAAQTHQELANYHRLFDIYNNYEGINNLKTVNDMAGIAPVCVDGAIIDLLKDCGSYYELTGGRVNVAMGSVLALWHEARNLGLEDPDKAALPDMQLLEEAAKHTDFYGIIIDEAASTVYLSDPQLRLDVGAVAKGWAAQRVAEQLPEGMLLSLGGNICATGPKTGDTPWVIGVQNPEGEGYLHTLDVTGGSFVTSGDYQRTYQVDGRDYHHIIDPDTLMPGAYWRSVTVVSNDSGLADALSTALFLMDRETGQELLEKCGAEAMWADAEGNIFYSPGFEDYIRD